MLAPTTKHNPLLPFRWISKVMFFNYIDPPEWSRVHYSAINVLCIRISNDNMVLLEWALVDLWPT